MALRYNNHGKLPELEAELRSLANQIDALAARPITSTTAAPVDPVVQTPDGIVRSWTLRLDHGDTFQGLERRTVIASLAEINAPGFTHLGMWIAFERVVLNGMGWLISVGPDNPINRFNAAAGGAIPLTPPIYDISAQGQYVRGKGRCYEFQAIGNNAVVGVKEIVPTFLQPWENGDIAYFPVSFAGAESGRLNCIQIFSNPTGGQRSVCIRGVLTGLYLEHAEPVANSWTCSTFTGA